jgi:hypothetical protein
MIPIIVPPRVLTLKAIIKAARAIALPIKRGATIQTLTREPKIPVPMTSPSPAK